MRKPRANTKPDGSIFYGKRGSVYKKIDGKWVYQHKYPNGFVDKWGNYSPRGRGDAPSVIGKYGPRPELRSLVYGVGVNDVMIPEFTKSRIWKQWNGIIRRTDKRDLVWLQTKPQCTNFICKRFDDSIIVNLVCNNRSLSTFFFVLLSFVSFNQFS